MPHTVVNPPSLGKPIGYSNGVLASGGKLLFVAGQVAWNAEHQVVTDDFAGQFAQALRNVLEVVHAAGGTATDIAQLTIYVTNREEYLSYQKPVGAAYRESMGKHYPAMALVEVAALLEAGAKVEIQAIAVINLVSS